MIEQFRQPEYLHVLINPLPVYGLLLGLGSLVLALALRSRAAQVTALSVILLASASAWPAYSAGQRGYNKIYLIVDDDGKAWLDAHKHHAEKTIYLFAALAVLTVAAIVLPSKMPKTAVPLALVTLLVGLIALGVGGWIARAGGKVRHEEFRKDPLRGASQSGNQTITASRFDSSNQIDLQSNSTTLTERAGKRHFKTSTFAS